MVISQSLSKSCPQIQNISFEQAQSLFESYFTLSTNRRLREVLYNVLEYECLEFQNPRQIINSITYLKYPNEAVIKSSFINNVLLKTKNHTTIFELKANGCRADLCKINGESIAFEIKTDLDTLERLDRQIAEYSKVFEKIYVICSKKRSKEIERALPDNVGIYTYKGTRVGNYTFEIMRSAETINDLDSSKQLSMLTKKERALFSVDSFSDPSLVNQIFKQALKERYNKQWSFIRDNQERIYDIDYQWFFKNCIDPQIVYSI